MATGSSDALTPPSDPEPVGTTHAAGHGKWLSQRIKLERRRLALALALSLLLHTLLLTLTFGGYGLGIPGFGFPWQDRRIETPIFASYLFRRRSRRWNRTQRRPRSRRDRHGLRSLIWVGCWSCHTCPLRRPRGRQQQQRSCRGPVRVRRLLVQTQLPRPVQPLRKRVRAPSGPVTRRRRRLPNRP
jgi:hypothetical protein